MRGGAHGNGGGGNHWIRDAKRNRIYERDGWRCWACLNRVANGRDIKTARPGVRLATLDHVLSRAKGGTNDASNLITMCGECNSDKGDSSAVAYAFAKLPNPGGALSRLLDCVMAPLPPAVRVAA